MNSQTPHHGLTSGQRGFVLIFALLILMTLTFLGFMAVRTAVTENTMSGNERVQRETFSLADGGTEVAAHMFQENMDCTGVGGFSHFRLAQGIGAIVFQPSALFAGTGRERDYTERLPGEAQGALPPAYDNDPAIAPNPEILRHFCVAGEGVNIAGSNGCNPAAAAAGAPHTNILYNPNPDGTGPRRLHGYSASSTPGGGPPGKGTATDVDIFSQHVAYQANNPVPMRESIIRMRWTQPNDSQNNCRW